MDQNFALLPAVINRRRLPAIATFISVICGAIAYLIVTPRLYEASVRLLLDDKQVSFSELGRDLTTQADIPGANPIATQAELVRSQRVLRRAIAQTNLLGTDEGESKLTLGQLRGGLRTSIVPATRILEITYRSQDPVLTAAVLNAVSEAMVQENAATIRTEAGSARRFLAAEVPKKRAQLAQAEAALSHYKRTRGIVSLADANGQDNSQTRSLIASLTALEDQARSLSAQLQEAKVRNNSLGQITDSGTLKSTYAAVRTGQDQELKSLRAKLTDLESQVAIARSRFTKNNPTLLTLLEKRDATRALYAQKMSSLVAGNNSVTRPANVASDEVSQDLATKLILGRVEVSALASKLAVVRREQANLQARLNQLPAREQELAVLTRQRQEAATSLELLQRKLEEARIAEAQLVSNAKIIDPAELPAAPNWPKLPVVLVIATATGIVLAIGVVLLLELLDGTLRNATEAEELVKLPVLGVLPALPKTALDLERPEFLQDPALLESYRTLLKSIEFRSAEDLQVVVVSSSLSGEGKSVVVSHLAAVSAMLSRRTLIIDADLRRPTQHKLFNLAAQPGLTDVVNGNFTSAEAVQHTRIRDLSVLTSGKPHLQPSEFFESKRMRTLLAEAASQYDLVIIDTPPITSCVDALTLSRDSNHLLLVARPNFTQKDILMRAVSELTSNHIGILGIAINGITAQTEKFYRYALQDYQPLNKVSNN
jgi:capsular exopolysaccharide synthesis family protein